MSFKLVYKFASKFINNILSSKLVKSFDMRRSGSDIESSITSKKRKLTKEEKKILHKQYKKARDFETKKSSLIKNYYTENCEYYFENGLRKVKPYYFTFQSNVKQRWLNKVLSEVFLKEFYVDNLSYLLGRIDKGYLLINNTKSSADYCLQSSDIITHKIHRHELPVLDQPINVVHEDDNVLVVCKPSSIPIHSVSKYHFNTVQGILTRSHGIDQLRIVHRIDRMTSGILIFAKNYITALNLSNEIKDRVVSKFYLAIVKGQFNSEIVKCEMPLGILCPKLGLMHVMSTEDGGKEASTKMVLLRYDSQSDTSLVLCKPLTGRTHQIRIHLQYLGHPIINDPLYNSIAWGPDLGKGAIYHKSKDQLIEDLKSNHNIAYHYSLETGNYTPSSPGDESSKDVLPDFHDPDCDECIANRPFNVDPASLVLYLHAYRYRSLNNEWDYRTDLPDWTNQFFVDSEERETISTRLDSLTTSNDEM